MALIDDIRVDIGDDDGVAPSGSISAQHALLSSTHPDTTPASPTNGALIRGVGNSWSLYPAGINNEVLTLVGGLPVWASGTVGPQGIAGPSGAQGLIGSTGPSGAIGPQGPVALNNSVLHWGNGDVGISATTRYLQPGYAPETARSSPVRYFLPRSGVLKNLHILHETFAGNGNPIVYTVRIEGNPTTLSVSMLSTASSGVNTSNNIFVAGPLKIDIEVTKVSGIMASPSQITASLEFE